MTVVAAIQMTTGADVARNLADAWRLLREARAQDAEIAALPENFALMGNTEQEKLAIAERPGDGPIQSLRGWLQKRRHAAEQNLEQSAASEAMRALLELRPRFAGLAVYPDDFSPLAEGLKRCYREARQAFRHSVASDSAEDVHQWRKGVQHHWRQMQLLAACWPSELSARVEASRTLSQLLGDDHDIALLTQLDSTPTMTFGKPEEIAAFLKRCRKRHKALRKEARATAEILFVEKPGPVPNRIAAYWLSAAGKAASAAATEQPGNVVAFGDLRTRAS